MFNFRSTAARSQRRTLSPAHAATLPRPLFESSFCTSNEMYETSEDRLSIRAVASACRLAMKSMTAVRRRRYVRRWFAIGLQTRCIGGAMKALTWCGPRRNCTHSCTSYRAAVATDNGIWSGAEETTLTHSGQLSASTSPPCLGPGCSCRATIRVVNRIDAGKSQQQLAQQSASDDR